MTPEMLAATLNTFTPLALLVIGLVVKYVPAFTHWPNKAIPYINVVVAFLAQVFAPQAAHAAMPGVFAVASLNIMDALAKSFLHSILARQLYEGFARPAVEKVLYKNAPVASVKKR